MDHAIRPSEEVSLSAWMHVPDERLDTLAKALSPGDVEPIAPASLACPRDSATLTAQLINSARFYVCPSCGGMWVSGSQLQVFLASSAVDLNLGSLKIPASSEHQSKPPRGSARCLCTHAAQMKTVRRLGVAVDICPVCGATWLDGGELFRMANAQSWQQQRNQDSTSILLFQIFRDL
jgi:Zn-finger nucleic acid-binding protein